MAAQLIAVSNRSQVGWSPTNLLLLTAFTIILGTSGVVMGPTLNYRAALAENRTAEVQSGTFNRLQAQVEAAQNQVDHEQLDAIAAQLHRIIPPVPNPLKLYSEVRAAADLAGVELRSLTLAKSTTPMGLGGQDQWVYLATLDISGSAQPASLARLIQLLRLSGQPTLITNFDIQRTHPNEPVFQFHMQLGFPHYAPSPSTEL